MAENDVIWWSDWWFLAWMRDCFRGPLLYLLQKIDNTRYIPETEIAVLRSVPEQTAEDEFQVYEMDNIDDSLIDESFEEPNEDLNTETNENRNAQPEPCLLNPHLQELFDHNTLLRQRESSLMQMLDNTTDGSFRLIMTPGTDSTIFTVFKSSGDI